MPAELNPWHPTDIVKNVTANASLQPAYEAAIKKIAGIIDAEIDVYDVDKFLFQFFIQDVKNT